MTPEASESERLVRIEERLGRLEALQDEARERDRRRRRQERWLRIAFALIVGVAYVLYLRKVTAII